MIFYFSATGNSKYVASRLAEARGERMISIIDCLRKQMYAFDPSGDERIGFVTPTYFGGLPIVVTDFLNRMELTKAGARYAYHVLTFGTTTGFAHSMMARYLKKQGLPLRGRFIIRMVDTWTPLFDLSDAEKNTKMTEAAEPRISSVIDQVAKRIAGDFNDHKLPRFIAAPFYAQYRNGKATRDFTVGDSCIGCGLCSHTCPVQAIEMRDGKPAWTKERCAVCLGCLHRCPEFAIQYGRKTKNHGQFVNPNVRL
jgi:ferredoxin/flavodoxin